MKKIIVFVWLLCLLLLLRFQGVFADGTCGTNVKYTISGNTISFSKSNSGSNAVWAENCGTVFKNDSKITSVKINDTIKVTNGYQIFKNFGYIEQMDLEKLDVSNVTNMFEMFAECSSLTSLGVSQWNTANVTDMGGMFHYCSSLLFLDVSRWDTANVTNMIDMFFWCNSLTSLDVSKWNTANVTNMVGVFAYCYSLTSLDLSKWNTTKVIDMQGMFYDCSSLTSLDVSKWNTANLTNTFMMFSGCSSLTSLDVSKWNTAKVTSMVQMFYGCRSLTSLDVSGWDTARVTKMDQMFSNSSALDTITIGKNSLKKNIFETLPNYNSTWYYLSAGADAGNPLALKTSKSGSDLFGSYNYNTMAGTWTSRKYENPITAGKYMILVVDENGAPLPGAAVTWKDQTGTQTGTSDAAGMVLFNAFSYRQPVITVSKTNYMTWSNKDINWEKNSDGWDKVILYPKSSGNLKLSSARYSNSRNMSLSTDLLTKTKKVSLGNDLYPGWDLDHGDFYLSFSAVDPAAVSSYELWQGLGKIAQSTDGSFALNADQFSDGAGCFVRVFGTDGKTHADTAINLVFAKAVKNKANALNFTGKKISFAVADGVPFLGGSNVDIDFSKLGLKFPVGVYLSENKVKITFNHKLNPAGDEKKQLKNVKEFTTNMKRLYGLNAGNHSLDIEQVFRYNDLRDKTYKPKFLKDLNKDVEVSILGYGEGDWSSEKITVNVMIMAQADLAGFEFNTWCVVVPVTVQVMLSAEGNAAFEASYDIKNSTLDGNIAVNIKPKLNAFGGIGVSTLVGVGAYGSAELAWEVEILPSFFETNLLDLTGELGVKAYLGIFTYEKPFAYNTWHLYTRTNPKTADLSEEGSVPIGLYDASQYRRADFSYLAGEAVHMGAEKGDGPVSKTGEGDEGNDTTALIENTYRNARPVMISTGGAAYAAFLRADTSGRVYVVVSKFDGSGWSSPVEVDSSDVLADSPKLIADARGRVWLAYARTGSAYDGSSMSNWAENQELVVGRLDPDTLGFTPLRVYSGMDYVHMHTFALVKGIPVLVWLSSQVETDNDVLWPVSSTIYSAQYSWSAIFGDYWSNAVSLTEADHVITELAAGDENERLSVAYVMDADNDHETADDHTLVRRVNDKTQVLSENAMAVSYGLLPGAAGPGFIWIEGGTLHSSNGSADFPATISGEYRIVDNSIYYNSAAEKGTVLSLSRYENGKWSLPISLTNGGGYMENINAARINGTDYFMGLFTLPTISESSINDNKILVWTGISTVSDIVIESVEYDDASLMPGETVPVTLTVLNGGDHTVPHVDVAVDDQIIFSKIVNLGLGERKQINVDLSVPSDLQVFRLKVSETGNDDLHPVDNEAEVTLGCPDLSVTLEWDQVGDMTKVAAVIQNNGIASTAGTLSFLGVDGKVLSVSPFSEMAPGDRVVAFYDLNWKQIPEDQFVVRAVVTGEKAENILYNNDDSVHLMLPPKATQVIIQDADGNDVTGQTVIADSRIVQLMAAALPSGAAQKFTWSGSNEVGTVDTSGKVSLKKGGNVTITAAAADGSKKSAKVTISYDPVRCFVQRCYDLILLRKADQGGLIYYMERLKSGKLTGAQMVMNFINSPEFQGKKYSNEQVVKILYQTMMDRNAEPSGLAYWTGFLNDGLTQKYVIRGFAGSAEFKNICSTYGITAGTLTMTENREKNGKVTQFVSRNYRIALERRGDVNGLNYWTGKILTKTLTPQQVADSFVFSKECVNRKLNNTDFIIMLYNLYMDRTPGQSEINYYLQQISKGVSRQTIARNFGNSPEFKKIVASYGL